MAYKPKNNAKSTLASGILSTDLTCTVASGDGNLKFPALSAGDYFHAYLINSSAQYEIVKVTARSSDAMTIERAQQGTTAKAFSAGDAFALRYTAADIEENVTRGNAQDGKPNYLGTLSGTNTLTATATPTSTAYVAGQRWTGKAAGDNTGAVTLNVDSLGAKDVKDVDGNALQAGDIQQDAVHEFLYTGTYFVLVNPSVVRKSGDTMTGPLVLSGDAPFDLTAVAIPECGRLEYNSATSITLNPYRGNRIAIKTAAGRWQLSKIPSAGTELLTTALTSWNGSTIANNTTYYIYAYDNAGTLALEASTTAYSTDTDTGVEIKTGDATRRLVGMVRSNGSGQISHSLTPAADTAATVGVISRLNRRTLVASTTRSGSVTRSATSVTELAGTLAITFVTWGDEVVRASAQFRVSIDTATEVFNLYSYIDGGSGGPIAQMQEPNANHEQTLAIRVSTLLSAGKHEWSPYYSVSGGIATVHVQDAKVVQCEVMG